MGSFINLLILSFKQTNKQKLSKCLFHSGVKARVRRSRNWEGKCSKMDGICLMLCSAKKAPVGQMGGRVVFKCLAQAKLRPSGTNRSGCFL